jgi:hypothetical protein
MEAAMEITYQILLFFCQRRKVKYVANKASKLRAQVTRKWVTVASPL